VLVAAGRLELAVDKLVLVVGRLVLAACSQIAVAAGRRALEKYFDEGTLASMRSRCRPM
jgi:hypothetical protein